MEELSDSGRLPEKMVRTCLEEELVAGDSSAFGARLFVYGLGNGGGLESAAFADFVVDAEVGEDLGEAVGAFLDVERQLLERLGVLGGRVHEFEHVIRLPLAQLDHLDLGEDLLHDLG